jgi:DNA anti-recombination protein RmuC
MPFIALATLGVGIYTANRQAAAASAARADANRQATAASQQAEKQIAAQREAANTARDRLSFEINQSAADRARVEGEAQKMATDLETQQRQYAEEEAKRMTQMRRGGMRALLSQERLNPELGLGSYDASTFGAGMSLQ